MILWFILFLVLSSILKVFLVLCSKAFQLEVEVVFYTVQLNEPDF